MLLLAKYFAKVFSILNGEISPRQIAAGFAWGVLIGLLPLSGFMPYVMLILAFIININLAIMFLAAGAFKFIAFLIDPIANAIGYKLLVNMPPLKGFWTHLYNLPVVPYTKFNNTLVMGSLVVGLLLLIPSYIFAKWAVVRY